MKKSSNSIAKKIGVLFAHIQGFFDELFSLIFKSLREKTEEKVEDEKDSGKFKKVVKKSAHFIGEMGDGFYEKYEQIKAKQKERREKEE